MKYQNDEEKKGEILFRSKLYEQHVLGRNIFEDEFNKDEIAEIIRSRVAKSDSQFSKLKEKGVALSPFLEVGAERCQRSMLLSDKYDSLGFAVDISYDSLRSADYFFKKFKMKRMPIRVCCDAYNLPFRNNSFPFVFCYETLHHFPDPTPIVGEIKRVMSRGHFFFDEEPVKQILNLKLYKRKNKIYSIHERRKNKVVRVIEHFISTRTCNEEEYGIIENVDISLKHWKRISKMFDHSEVDLVVGPISCKLNYPRFSLKRTLANLAGGSITGLCFADKKMSDSSKDVFGLLGCPNCLQVEDNCDTAWCNLECKQTCSHNAIDMKDGKASIIEERCVLCGECSRTCPRQAINKHPLVRIDNELICENCGNKYPTIQNIIMLFSKREEKLYEHLKPRHNS